MNVAHDYMRRALELARRGEGRTCPNPPVGAVVVADGRIVGEGFHPRAGEPHAEIHALRQAGEAARGATIYVTLEPCSHQGRTGPCADALIAAGVARVVVAVQDPNPLVAGSGLQKLRAAGLEVETGLCAAEAACLLAPFAHHITCGCPFVTLKAAMTLDGRTATAAGESQWISGEASRRDVHELRNRVDGILVGVGTVLRDNPRLTTRLGGEGRDAVRVVVDSRLRIPLDAALITQVSAAPTLVATTPLAPKRKIAELQDRGVQVLTCNEIEGQGVDLRDLLRQLGGYPLQHLMLEGGALLNQSFLAAGLVDRIRLYVAPQLFGGSDGKGLFSGYGIMHLAQATRLGELRVERFGSDLRIEGEVLRCSPD